MAITDSWGYAGDVNAPEWAQLIPYAGGVQYGVLDFASWRPTVGGPGDRAITIDAGIGWGHGVMDVNDGPVTLNLASGDRWDLLVARRLWGTGETSFEVVQGSTSRALPSRMNTPGTEDEQPIALARVQGAVVVEVVDLRCIPGDGGVIAFDPLVLQYLNRLGTRVRVGDVGWTRGLTLLGAPQWLQADVGDTGWLTVLAGVSYGGPFGSVSMRVRRVAGRVVGSITIQRTATTPHSSPNAQGQFAGPATLLRLPEGWRPGGDVPVDVRSAQADAPFFGSIDSGGLVQVRHSLGATFTPNGRYVVHFDHMVS